MARTRPRCREPEFMCWLCGLCIQLTTDNGLSVSPWGSYCYPLWTRLCRLITFSEEGAEFGDKAIISGVGHRRNDENAAGVVWPLRDQYVVPTDRHASVEDNLDEADLRVVHTPAVYDPDRRLWTFRVHAACWEIIEAQCADAEAAATIWVKAMATLNWSYSFSGRVGYPQRLFDTPHPRELLFLENTAFDGAEATSVSPARLPSAAPLLAELGAKLLPFFRPPTELTEFALYTPEGSNWVARGCGTDVFAQLPEEIIQVILSCTPTPDLLNLRLASKAVAYASRLRALPQSFWCSRFLPEFERGYAMPEQSDMALDWRSLYFLTGRGIARIDRKTLDKRSWLAQLAKRRLWWARFEEIASLYRRFGSGSRPLGTSFTWRCLATPDQKDEEGLSLLLQVIRPVKVVTSQLHVCGSDTRDRDFSTTRLPWDILDKRLYGIGVSTTKLRGYTYVTGFRLLFRDDVTTEESEESLGYVRESSEDVHLLQAGEVLHGFKFHVNEQAIRGLQLVLMRSSGRLRVAPWVGENGEADNEGMYSLLFRRSRKTPFTLAASFDYFRMIAVGILEATTVCGEPNVGAPERASLSILPQPTTRPCVIVGGSQPAQPFGEFYEGHYIDHGHSKVWKIRRSTESELVRKGTMLDRGRSLPAE